MEYFDIAVSFALAVGAGAFHARQKSGWTLFLAFTTIAAAVWFPLEHWAALAAYGSGASQPAETAIFLHLFIRPLVDPALRILFALAFLGVAFTSPRKSSALAAPVI